jgi:hypothetical protein
MCISKVSTSFLRSRPSLGAILAHDTCLLMRWQITMVWDEVSAQITHALLVIIRCHPNPLLTGHFADPLPSSSRLLKNL